MFDKITQLTKQLKAEVEKLREILAPATSLDASVASSLLKAAENVVLTASGLVRKAREAVSITSKPTPEEKFQQWSSELDQLRQGFWDLVHVDDVFWQMQAILEQNDKSIRDNTFPQWMFNCYIAKVTIGLRTFADGDHRSLSLVGIIEDMARWQMFLTRENHRKLYHQLPTFTEWDEIVRNKRANTNFDELAGAGESVVPEALLQAHIKSIKTGTDKISKYVNAYVAHKNREPRELVVELRELREALRQIFEVLRFASRLVDATDFEAMPWLGNWTRIFNFAWLPPGQDPPAYSRLLPAKN